MGGACLVSQTGRHASVSLNRPEPAGECGQCRLCLTAGRQTHQRSKSACRGRPVRRLPADRSVLCSQVTRPEQWQGGRTQRFPLFYCNVVHFLLGLPKSRAVSWHWTIWLWCNIHGDKKKVFIWFKCDWIYKLATVRMMWMFMGSLCVKQQKQVFLIFTTDDLSASHLFSLKLKLCEVSRVPAQWRTWQQRRAAVRYVHIRKQQTSELTDVYKTVQWSIKLWNLLPSLNI